MIVIGIDPGSRKAGYGVIKVSGKKIEYIDSGVLRYDHVPDFLDRLRMIYKSCLELVAKFEPQEVSLESLIYVKSVTSLAKLAQARGAMIAALSLDKKTKLFEYSPNLVKSSVTGHGHADKAAVAKSLKMILGTAAGREFKSGDESDALAIAICHALNRNSYDRKVKTIGPRKGGRSLKASLSHLSKEL